MTDAASRTLDDWLVRIERLHPKTIDLGLERLRVVAGRLALSLPCVVITVGGTNGKGSTCAMLEAILLAAGYRVGLYTSPHLVRFNERARLDGTPVEDRALVEQFEAVEAARGDVALTYFEFSTLAVLRLFQQRAPDVAILEVGLGGRLDAVNLVDADCAIVTSVDVDHAEYLGDTRERIGWEKAHVFRAGRPAICSDPMPPAALVEYARSIGADLWLHGRDFNHAGDRQQWSYGGRGQRRTGMAYPALRGANQLQNAAGALAALEALRDRLPVSQQAVRQGLATVELPGRFQVLPGHPPVILDVAHNPHAAAHLAINLDAMGAYRQTFAVFGVMRDKDVDGVIAALRHRVDHWLPVDLPGARAASASWIAERLEAAGVTREGAKSSIECHASPSAALAAARGRAGGNDRIVVFGSFLTVADILAARAR
ncbi:MAG: bifunctional tetrahydrofolate synthase/dihydrofolate synthase [Burkholderiales bacterium]|nr:MAG: bifunctional tetrahydrofolate synthase/dihydrofolate synthase [Burkholderiales bacterium]